MIGALRSSKKRSSRLSSGPGPCLLEESKLTVVALKSPGGTFFLSCNPEPMLLAQPGCCCNPLFVLDSLPAVHVTAGTLSSAKELHDLAEIPQPKKTNKA